MLTLKQSLRESEIVKKILGDPWGLEESITKREARDLIAHHGFELTDTGEDHGFEVTWGDSITFTRGRFTSTFRIWEHRSNCIEDLNDSSKCSCRGDIVRIV